MNFYKSYRKYLFKRDTLLATISVFVVIGLLGLLPLNTKVLNPFKVALTDFDFNDIAYSKLGKNKETPFDPRIAVVNIGQADRAQIAQMLEKVSASEPKAIGIDARFEGARDPAADAYLKQTLQQTPNLVLASKINWKSKHNVEEKGYFVSAANSFGYVNFIGEEGGTIRYFSPFEQANGVKHLSFTAALIQKASPHTFRKLMKRQKETELIHYTRHENQYLVVDGADLLEDQVADSLFKNKIVLLGYVNSSPFDVEDKHFTPFNEKIAGKSLPDMNGVFIHANILSMVLDNSYIKKIPAWINWAITILIAWLHMVLFIRYYIESHIWFHLVAKIAQLLSAIFFVYLSIMLFHLFNLKVSMKLATGAIILAIDVIYFYEAFALWLNKKWKYRTVFLHTHHHPNTH